MSKENDIQYRLRALDLLLELSRTKISPEPEELSPNIVEQHDPIAAKIMRSEAFTEGKLLGKHPIHLTKFALEASSVIKVFAELAHLGMWGEQLEEMVKKSFAKVRKALDEAAGIYLIGLFWQKIRRGRGRRKLNRMMEIQKLLGEMEREAVEQTLNPPPYQGDLADELMDLLGQYAPSASRPAIGEACERILVDSAMQEEFKELSLEVEVFDADTYRKRLERKTPPKNRSRKKPHKNS